MTLHGTGGILSLKFSPGRASRCDHSCWFRTQVLSAALQSYSKRIANAKSDKYHSNVHKRGKVWEGKEVRWLAWNVCDAQFACCLSSHACINPDVWSSRLRSCHLVLQKSRSMSSAGPWLLGFFVFVLVGSGEGLQPPTWNAAALVHVTVKHPAPNSF